MRTRLHAVARRGYHATEKFPQSCHVAAIVAWLIDRCFENKGAPGEERVIQNAAEGVEADFALADMLVTVHARTVMCFPVVDVTYVHAIKAHGAVNRPQRGFQALGGAQVPACSESVGGIDADAERKLGRCLENGAPFFEARADGRALTGGVFQ